MTEIYHIFCLKKVYILTNATSFRPFSMLAANLSPYKSTSFIMNINSLLRFRVIDVLSTNVHLLTITSRFLDCHANRRKVNRQKIARNLEQHVTPSWEVNNKKTHTMKAVPNDNQNPNVNLQRIIPIPYNCHKGHQRLYGNKNTLHPVHVY